MQMTNISEAQSGLSSLIAQVEKGHKIIIGKAGKPIAMLIPFPSGHIAVKNWRDVVWKDQDGRSY